MRKHKKYLPIAFDSPYIIGERATVSYDLSKTVLVSSKDKDVMIVDIVALHSSEWDFRKFVNSTFGDLSDLALAGLTYIQ